MIFVGRRSVGCHSREVTLGEAPFASSVVLVTRPRELRWIVVTAPFRFTCRYVDAETPGPCQHRNGRIMGAGVAYSAGYDRATQTVGIADIANEDDQTVILQRCSTDAKTGLRAVT